MPTTDYENRFRDPAFISVWQRWQDARHDWCKQWWNAPLGTDPYDPVPERIEIPSHPKRSAQVRVSAQEFLNARTVYLEKLHEYVD